MQGLVHAKRTEILTGIKNDRLPFVDLKKLETLRPVFASNVPLQVKTVQQMFLSSREKKSFRTIPSHQQYVYRFVLEKGNQPNLSGFFLYLTSP